MWTHPHNTCFRSLASLWMANLTQNIFKCKLSRFIPFSVSYTFSCSFGNLKKGRLVELCRGFGLPHTGNMQMLRDRLREFSGSREQWNRYIYKCTSNVFAIALMTIHPRLVVNARNAHLGPRDGKHTKAKSQKKSAQRRETMFENSISQVDPFPARRLPTIPSTAAVLDTQHIVKQAATLQWVRPCFI